MSEHGRELEAIEKRYARRGAGVASLYAPFNPDVLARTAERRRTMVSLLAGRGIHSLEGLDVVEVGCGTGGNLLELLELGADPERVVGNELLPQRLETARRRLPPMLRLMAGDASQLPFDDACFDIVFQSTVFSSILDDELQHRVAAAMWRWARRGGGILWYDFTFDNPSNLDVRGVPLARLRQLFPQGRIHARRVTLAPPIARRACRLHPGLYPLLNAIPLLRTHLLCWIEKP